MTTVPSTVSLKWLESTLMAGVDSRGKTLMIGYHKDETSEWAGLKPSDLLLLAAASCSTYDVVTILTKQREPLEGLDVVCTGDQEAEAPYQFVAIHLHYIIKGKVSPDKVEKAIHLSEDKYCSVLNTLKPNVKVSSDYEIK